MENGSRRFIYKALNQNKNRIVKGIMQTGSPQMLEEILGDSNLLLISYKEIKKSFLHISFFDKVTTRDLITFFVHLEQLERAGVPLLDSISDLKDFSDKPLIRDISADIYESIKNGKLLSEAMENHKKVFDNVMISLVRMGEKTGNLQLAFRNIHENLKWIEEIKRKTFKAIRYPLFSLLVMVVAAFILLKVVVPKVTGFIVEQGIPVPIYTIALINLSNFLQRNFFNIIFWFCMFFVVLRILKSNKKTRYYVDYAKIRIPLVGQVYAKIDISKFCKFFGVTFTSGVPILECLRIARDIMSSEVLKEEVSRVIEDVTDGSTVSEALSQSDYFASIVIRMLKVGEESGNMGDAMDNIQYFYSREIDDGIDAIVGSIQPTIMFAMGGLMAWIVIAVFGPIYGNFDTLGA